MKNVCIQRSYQIKLISELEEKIVIDTIYSATRNVGFTNDKQSNVCMIQQYSLYMSMTEIDYSVDLVVGYSILVERKCVVFRRKTKEMHIQHED